MEAIVWKADVDNQEQQSEAEKKDFEETHGKVGHRHPDFIERARAAEAAR